VYAGASKTLATLIEGESLINDGTAIVLFTVFGDVLFNSIARPEQKELEFAVIAPQFLYVGLVGPIVGYVMGYISTFFLKIVYNDHLVEVSIALVMPYITYYVGKVCVYLLYVCD
jgi:NhaP-type Na+/H+ or K+/H+ antiporter